MALYRAEAARLGDAALAALQWRAMRGSQLLAFTLLLSGCNLAPSTATSDGDEADGSGRAPRVVWNEDQARVVGIKVRNGSIVDVASLAWLDSMAPGLLTECGAVASLRDLDGDGVSDLSLWSEASGLLAVWPAWADDPEVAPQVHHTRSVDASPSDRFGLRVFSSVQRDDEASRREGYLIAVFADQTLHQLVDDPAYGVAHRPNLHDVSFDGHADLLVPIGNCTGNCVVDVWLFDVRRDRFVASPLLTDVSNLSIGEPTDRVLESRRCRGSGCDVFSATQFHISGTQVEVFRTAEQELVDASTLHLTVRERASDGTLAPSCESRFSVTAEQPESGSCSGWPVSRTAHASWTYSIPAPSAGARRP